MTKNRPRYLTVGTFDVGGNTQFDSERDSSVSGVWVDGYLYHDDDMKILLENEESFMREENNSQEIYIFELVKIIKKQRIVIEAVVEDVIHSNTEKQVEPSNTGIEV